MIRSSRLLAMAFMFCVCQNPGVLADPGAGTGPGKTRAASMNGRTKRDMRETSRRFGACVVNRYPDRVKRILAMPIGGEYRRNLDRLVVAECLNSGELSMSDDLMRYALFEALYMREFHADYKRNPGSITVDYVSNNGESADAASRQTIALGRLGECVARNDAANGRRLMLALPESDEERKAFVNLAPRVAGCVPQDYQVVFSKSVLRGAIAEGMYKLSISTGAANMMERN